MVDVLNVGFGHIEESALHLQGRKSGSANKSPN